MSGVQTCALAFLLGVMVLLDPVLAVVVVAAVGAFWLTSRGAGARITQASRRTRQGEGRLADTAQESLSSIAVVQSYGLEDLIARRFASANQVSLRQGMRALCLSARLERGTDVIVEPGDRLDLRAELAHHRERLWQFRAQATVQGQLRARCELTMMVVQDDIS